MQKYIFILFIFIHSCFTGQKFPVKRTFDYSKWYIITGKDLKKGDYFEDKAGKYNPYAGTWSYKKNNLVFILKLQKVQFLFASKDDKKHYWYMDRMVSTYKIIKDDIVLIDNLNAPAINTFYQRDKKEKYQYGSFMIGTDNNSLEGELRDTILKDFYTDIYYNNIDDKIKIKFNNFYFSCKHSVMGNEPLCLLPIEIELSRCKSDN